MALQARMQKCDLFHVKKWGLHKKPDERHQIKIAFSQQWRGLKNQAFLHINKGTIQRILKK